MPAKHLTTEECVELLDEDVRSLVMQALAIYKSQGVLIFSNRDMCSARCGESFAIGWGPENTVAEVPADGKCPVRPPNGDVAWRYYLDAYSDDLIEGVFLQENPNG